MPKENDLEGRQDRGDKHSGQAGMPRPASQTAAQQGIARVEKGNRQPPYKSGTRQRQLPGGVSKRNAAGLEMDCPGGALSQTGP